MSGHLLQDGAPESMAGEVRLAIGVEGVMTMALLACKPFETRQKP